MKANTANTSILVVDDEPNIIVAVEFLLKQEGYEVFKAYNGVKALEAMKTHQPSIIVLDVMMPEMDGFEVARTIRANPNWEDVRIIFLTAKGTTADRFEGYANGGEVYITKPFDNQALMDAINEVVAYG